MSVSFVCGREYEHPEWIYVYGALCVDSNRLAGDVNINGIKSKNSRCVYKVQKKKKQKKIRA